MKLFHTLFALVALAIFVPACAQPAPAPAPSQKVGLNVNSVTDIANTMGAIGAFFEYPAPTVTANLTVNEIAVGVVGPGPNAIPVGQISLHPTGAMTNTDNSNYMTITVSKRTAGGSAVPIAVITTQTTGSGGSGSWVAFTPFNLTLQTGTGSYVSPGDAITYKVSQTGTGNANASGTFYLAGFVKVL